MGYAGGAGGGASSVGNTTYASGGTNVSFVGADNGNNGGCWVTVFGFPPTQTSAVIEELLSCGQVSWRR